MPVSTKTRKILWARSGNHCAICRRELIVGGSADDPTAIVGDECHIISKRLKGPRSNQNLASGIDLDSYDNLILLCKTHHGLVDEQTHRFSVEQMQKIKASHEQWVRETLRGKAPGQQDQQGNPSLNSITLLPRIRSGKELVDIVCGAHLFRFDYDEVESREEMELVSSFFQVLHDWGDILDELGAGEAVRIGFELNQQVEELEQQGFLVFGERRRERLSVGGMVDKWIVATILVFREGNPGIISFPSEEAD